MKKLVFAVMAAAAMAASAETKIGTVDMLLLVRNHPNYDTNKTLLMSTEKDYQKKLEGIRSEGDALQEEGKKLMDQLNSPMLNDKAKNEAKAKFQDLQKKLMSIDQQYRSEAMRSRQQLQDLEAKLLKTTTDDLRKRIGKYAEEKGLDLVLDANAAPFAKKTLDVTDDMLKAMGVDLKDVKGRDDVEGK